MKTVWLADIDYLWPERASSMRQLHASHGPSTEHRSATSPAQTQLRSPRLDLRPLSRNSNCRSTPPSSPLAAHPHRRPGSRLRQKRGFTMAPPCAVPAVNTSSPTSPMCSPFSSPARANRAHDIGSTSWRPGETLGNTRDSPGAISAR